MTPRGQRGRVFTKGNTEWSALSKAAMEGSIKMPPSVRLNAVKIFGDLYQLFVLVVVHSLSQV